jgi:hypothetical protein
MLYRSASILGVTLGHIFSRQKSMAQSVSRRLSSESGHREVEKASSQPCSSFEKYVERRKRSFLFLAICFLWQLIHALQSITWSQEAKSYSSRPACWHPLSKKQVISASCRQQRRTTATWHPHYRHPSLPSLLRLLSSTNILDCCRYLLTVLNQRVLWGLRTLR